jgi:hypothetical protein
VRFAPLALGLAVAVVLSLPVRSEAAPISTVIDFNSAPTGAFSTLVVGDFTFTWVGFGDHQQIGTIGSGNNALMDANTANALGAGVMMTLTDGGTFSVSQFDIFSPSDPSATFTRVSFGGISYTQPTTGTVVRSDLVNVSSVLINIVADVSLAAVDNIHVTYEAAPAAVPEPATLMLVGLGVLGLTYRRRARPAA